MHSLAVVIAENTWGGAMLNVISGLVGVIVGSFLSWMLAQRSERNRTRRDVLSNIWQHIQNVKHCYANWYIAYGHLRNIGCTQVRPIKDGPDVTRLSIEDALDRGRSALHFDIALIRTNLPRKVAKDLQPHLDQVLAITQRKPWPSIEEVAAEARKAEERIEYHLPRFAK
jgi:hypothetical protein